MWASFSLRMPTRVESFAACPLRASRQLLAKAEVGVILSWQGRCYA